MMDLEGTYTFDAPPQAVWDVLMDTTAIAACIPGCEGLEPLGEDRYRATLRVALAAVTGTYQGTVAMTDKRPPESYRLIIEGQGRPGFVKGESAITIVPTTGGSTVRVAGTAQVGGAIARVGQRLTGTVAKMMLDRFFGCLQEKVKAQRDF
jgi:carbon monoxide dehydrogenase subunit G